MKKQLQLLLLCLFVSAPAVTAQTLRPAVLHKIDRTRLSVKIQLVGQNSIVFFEKSAPTTKRVLSRAKVWKIVYTNGTTQVITPIPNATPTAVIALDEIILRDSTRLSGSILRRTNDSLFYAAPSSGTAAPKAVLLSQVDRLKYADGRQETIAPAPVVEVAPTPAPVSNYRAIPQAVAKPARSTDAFNRLQVSIGPEVSFFPAFLNKDNLWISDTVGFGMAQNVGASLRIDYRIVRPVAISFSVGYAGWELARNFSREQKPVGTETVKLTRIPVQVGLKIYPTSGGLYLLPEAGVTLLQSSLTAEAGTPDTQSESVNKMVVNYGAGFGYEIRKGAILLDLGLRYTLTSVSGLTYAINSTTIDESVHSFSVRLGIGFGAMKK